MLSGRAPPQPVGATFTQPRSRPYKRTIKLPKIGPIRYPDDPVKILADRNIGPAYKRFLTEGMSTEVVMFLQGRFDPKKNYKVFIAEGSRNQLNIPHRMRAEADALAQANNWKLGAWREILEEIWDLVNDSLSMNYNKQFFASDSFKEIHGLLLADREAKRIARELGTKQTKALKNAIRALAMSETRKANKFIVEAQEREARILAMQNKPMQQEKPETILKRIKKKLGLK